MVISGTDKKSIFLKKPKLLYVSVFSLSQYHETKDHSHPFPEVMFVKSGKCLLCTGEEETRLKGGDVAAIDPGTVHREVYDDSEVTDVVFLGIGNLAISGLKEGRLAGEKGLAIRAMGNESDFLLGCLDRLLEENETKSPYFAVISDSLLLVTISYVLRLIGAESDAASERNAYLEAKEFLDENYTTIDSIDDVCKRLYISKFYLTHLFKDSLGQPPLKYIIGKRMALARRLLSTTDSPVGEIAKACGYTDTAYFCRLFKKVEDETPLAYRKRQKEISEKEDN